MASYQHLRKIAAIERQAALEVLEDLLSADSPSREVLFAAQRDAIARGDAEFQVHAIAGALCRIVAAQHERIAALEAAAPKRAKAGAKS